MRKTVFLNAPCAIWKDFLRDESSRADVLSKHLYCAVASEYDRLSNITNEDERWEQACNHLSCTIGDKEGCLTVGRDLNTKFNKEAIFSIQSDSFWEFHNNNKTDEECTLLLAYLALKSIIGTKPLAKTNKEMWFSRMDGNTKIRYFRTDKEGNKKIMLSEPVSRWNTKHGYGARKLKALLWKYYHVAFYSANTHGFYASISLSDTELARAAQQAKDNTIMNEFKKAQIAAKRAVKQ